MGVELICEPVQPVIHKLLKSSISRISNRKTIKKATGLNFSPDWYPTLLNKGAILFQLLECRTATLKEA
ncbi:MAG: hypothetical protein ACI843_002818 [Psychrobacter glaciei]|jgi:hypothetical protein